MPTVNGEIGRLYGLGMVTVDVIAIATVEAHIEIARHIELGSTGCSAKEGIPQIGIASLHEERDGSAIGKFLSLQGVRNGNITFLTLGTKDGVHHISIAQHIALNQCRLFASTVLLQLGFL